MHRAQVRAKTRRAQIGGAVLLLAATGLAVAPGSWAVGRGALEPPVAAKPERREAKPEALELPDASLLAMAFNDASPAMGREAPPLKQEGGIGPGAGNGTTGEPAPPLPPPLPAWKYVGAIIGPGVRKAIVSVDDKQQFAAEGERVRDDEIVEVMPDKLVVRRAGVERDVPMADKAERPVSVSAGGPIGGGGGVVPNPGMVPQPGVAGGSPVSPFNPATRQPANGALPSGPGVVNPGARRGVPSVSPFSGVKPGAPAGGRGTAPAVAPPRTNGAGNQSGRMTPAQIEELRQRRLREGAHPPAEEGVNQ